MARYNMPVALCTDLKNTVTAMRGTGLSESDVMSEVCRILRGLYYPDGEF